MPYQKPQHRVKFLEDSSQVFWAPRRKMMQCQPSIEALRCVWFPSQSLQLKGKSKAFRLCHGFKTERICDQQGSGVCSWSPVMAGTSQVMSKASRKKKNTFCLTEQIMKSSGNLELSANLGIQGFQSINPRFSSSTMVQMWRKKAAKMPFIGQPPAPWARERSAQRESELDQTGTEHLFNHSFKDVLSQLLNENER